MPAPIPALIVSGFLGAGKTTLVRHLLDEARRDGVRLAIVSNEFGDTGIDRALLDAGQDGLVELDGGCVCCKLSDALGQTLEALIEQVHPDRLLLETSGVALPGEILIQFWAPPLDALLGETTVAVVVDVEKVGSGMPDDDTFEEQLSAADVVVLNKCDLADDDALAAAEALLADVTQGQPVIRAVQGRVPSMLLFPTSGAPRRERPASEHHEHDHDVFVTEELRFDGVVSEDDVRTRLGDPPPLRAKGFVETIDGLRVVQGVGPRIGFEPPTQAPPPALVGTVVVIRRAS